jgi:uncharacterized protein
MERRRSTRADAVANLCPKCGLCCNGVLFGDVELQGSDDTKQLLALGLNLERKGKAMRFSQPCSCFDGALCKIYEQRPARCRSFECGLIRGLAAGKLTLESALKAIGEARKQVAGVQELLEKLGQRDQSLPLSRRCAKVISQPIDLTASEEEIEFRGELLLAISKLTNTLQRHFLEGSDI